MAVNGGSNYQLWLRLYIARPRSATLHCELFLPGKISQRAQAKPVPLLVLKLIAAISIKLVTG